MTTALTLTVHDERTTQAGILPALPPDEAPAEASPFWETELMIRLDTVDPTSLGRYPLFEEVLRESRLDSPEEIRRVQLSYFNSLLSLLNESITRSLIELGMVLVEYQYVDLTSLTGRKNIFEWAEHDKRVPKGILSLALDYYRAYKFCREYGVPLESLMEASAPHIRRLGEMRRDSTRQQVALAEQLVEELGQQRGIPLSMRDLPEQERLSILEEAGKEHVAMTRAEIETVLATSPQDITDMDMTQAGTVKRPTFVLPVLSYNAQTHVLRIAPLSMIIDEDHLNALLRGQTELAFTVPRNATKHTAKQFAQWVLDTCPPL